MRSLPSPHLDKFGTWWRPISRQKYFIFFSYALFLAFHMETVSQILPAPFTQFQSPFGVHNQPLWACVDPKIGKARPSNLVTKPCLGWLPSRAKPSIHSLPFQNRSLGPVWDDVYVFMLWSHSLCFPIHSKSLFRGNSLIPAYNAKGKKKNSSAVDGAGACVRWLVLVVWRQQQ